MKTLPLILLIALFLSACSSVGNSAIAQITPLPTRDNDALIPTIQIAPTVTPNPTLVSISLTRASLPTPTPLSVRMAQGEALEIIRATDAAIVFESEVEDNDEPFELTFDEFYDGFDEATGPIISEKLKSLDGRKVIINGYMAPPLALELDWFQLTLQPVGGCAFCGDSFSVTDGTALIYPINEPMFFTGGGIQVTGTIEVGDGRDPATGMISLVRIYAEDIEHVEVDW